MLVVSAFPPVLERSVRHHETRQNVFGLIRPDHFVPIPQPLARCAISLAPLLPSTAHFWRLAFGVWPWYFHQAYEWSGSAYSNASTAFIECKTVLIFDRQQTIGGLLPS